MYGLLLAGAAGWLQGLVIYVFDEATWLRVSEAAAVVAHVGLDWDSLLLNHITGGGTHIVLVLWQLRLAQSVGIGIWMHV